MKKSYTISTNYFNQIFALIMVIFAISSNPLIAQQKVVGGVDVDIKDYPWQVAVDYGCGGSIIGESWVLTAAHCVGGGVNFIHAGNSAPYAEGGESYSVNQVIIHPNYGVGTSYSHDYALVEINGVFDLSNPNIGIIDLINAEDVAAGSEEAGVMATITGWGTLSSGGSMASTLQMVQAPIVANEVACGSETDENGNSGDYSCSSLDGSMICSGDLIDGGEDACQGDSGGPLVVRSLVDNRWLLVGATSWGYGCADVNYPGVWSRVSYVSDWINQTAFDYGCMDTNACNFSPEAIFDTPETCIYEVDECGDCGGNGPAPGYDCDGNCTTGETLNVTMSDSWGDGWNGNTLLVNETAVDLPSGSSGSSVVCYDSSAGCVTVTCGGGSWQSEVSWEISDVSGNVLLTGGAPYEGGFGGEGCGPVVSGCMDTLALNFNPIAIEDDGSCQYPIDCSGLTSVLVEVTNGNWPSEVSWELGGFSGTVGSTEACLEDGCLSFKMYDSYGDGWNGSIVTISSMDGVLLTGTLESGSEGTIQFGLNFEGDCGPVYGCTDNTALNFDDSANIEDGSCIYPISGCMDTLALNYNQEAVVEDNSCYFDYDVLGCTDSLALNFNIETTYDDGSCEYPFTCEEGYVEDCDGSGECHPASWIGDNFADCSDQTWGADLSCYDNDGGDCDSYEGLGCTDTLALNFDEFALEDNGTCIYPIDCEGLTTVSIDVGGGSWQSEVSWELGGFSGGVGSSVACLEDGCLVFNMYDSWGDGWNGNNFTISSEEGDLLTGTLETGSEGTLSFALNFEGDCGPLYGCMDSTALNYDEVANTDDGSCLYPVSGCMDTLALNFNPAAVEDDGSCEYPINCDSLTAIVIEVGGGSWQSEVSWQLGSFSGAVGITEACIEDGCYEFIMYDSWGDGWNGNTVTISTAEEVIVSGTLDSGSQGTLLFSYNSDCGYVSGCMDSSASNYDSEAIIDDGSCLYPVYGCTDSNSLNFDASATEDDGSCEYPIDCDGLSNLVITMFDSFGDGWNGNDLIINGQSFTLDDNSEGSGIACVDLTSECIDVSCDGGSWQSEVSWTISDSDGNELLSGGAPYQGGIGDCGDITPEPVFGCMDMNALNYNPEANEEDGSCDYEDNSCTGVQSLLTINVEAFGNEISWEILSSNSVVVASGSDYTSNSTSQSSLCLQEGGVYTFIAEDSFGDGWNGATFIIENDDCELINGGLETGDYASYDFTVSCDDDSSGGSNSTVPWEVLVTGSNHTMIIDANSSIDLDGMTIEVGDALGVFYSDENGSLQCAGYITWTGENNAIAAQGDDSTTDEIDGFVSGENFVWMVWDNSEGMALMANATYQDNMPNQGSFVVNGISAISSLNSVPAITEQLLELPAGWSNFSVYMMADNMDLAYCLSSIVENVVIAKDNEGSAYLPDFNFNGVGDVEIGQGYQVKLLNESSILMPGTYMLPEENPIDLTPGWNMIGYLRLEGADAAAILADVVAHDNLVIAKDYEGNAYLPEFNFNGIGDMLPTQGYQLKVNEADQLLYLSNDESYRFSELNSIQNKAAHYSSFNITDHNMTVVIDDLAWDIIPENGSEIGAFDKYGKLVGACIYTSPVTMLSIWGDDLMTASKDGMHLLEEVSFKLWNSGEDNNLIISKWTEGSSAFISNSINVAGSIGTNPITSDSIINDRILIKVVNVLGQEVNLENESKGEILFHIYDDGSVDKIVR